MGYVIDSKYGRGFPRWERARVNSILNPDSPGAKLYQHRTAFAAQVADKIRRGGPLAFWHTGYKAGEVEYRVCSEYCAALQLQLEYGADTVDDAVSVLNAAYFLGGYYTQRVISYGTQPTDVLAIKWKAPQREVKCHTCWKRILPNGSLLPRVATSDVIEELHEKERAFHAKPTPEPEPLPLLGVVSPPEQPPADTNLYTINAYGEIAPLEDIAVVRLTARELELLELVAPADRVVWAQDNTLWVSTDAFTPQN